MGMIRGLAAALLLLPVLVAPAWAIGFAAGGYGVYNFPLVQDDAGGAPLYGVKAKISASPRLVLEPSFTIFSAGENEKEQDGITFTQEGISINSFALNVSLGGYRTLPGFGFYTTAGIGSYTLKPEVDYKDDDTRFGFNIGPGFIVKAAMIDVDVSGRFILIPLDGGGSRKSVGLFTGLNFYFGS